MANLRKRFSLILICVLALIFYSFVANLYFAQDDFFHLRVSQTDGSLREFLQLFSFRSFSERGGIYFFRPIFREGLFNIFYRIFGLTPVPFRILQIMFHLINIVLVYKLIKFLTKKERISLTASLIFGISVANVGVLSYLAGGIQASGMTMFLLLSAIYFLKERRSMAFLFFTLGLASHELAVAFPVVLGGLILIKHKSNNKIITQFLKQVWPYVVTAALFLYFQIKVIGLPTSEAEYSFTISLARVINSYVWYFVWSLGIPEMLLDFVGPGAKINPNLMRFWGNYFKVIFPLFGLLLMVLLVGMLKILKEKLFWFFVFWFTVGISPVVFLPLHRSTYYLAFSLVGVAGATALIVDELLGQKKSFGYLVIGTFLILNLATIILSQRTFWAITRSKISEQLLRDIKSTYPSLPRGATVYILNDPDYPVINEAWGGSAKQAKVALSGSDALVLLYRDETLKAFYEGEDPSPTGNFVFPIVAEIRI